ncbi:hypothetical protein H257_09019 [Aphanomyces astaci]|uniref:Uncharacterized protein n=2 Tax=Aphanomyces astaci TaxID=112090 RepID=W4GDV5_APHAT|nr:hypothetical protein H257_09019 [Aphanomyces astaci]ETV77123.1 hypothetical protein H257_09019 [Aphanomyces astaci]|eukprot:XP_009833429.1 hypothetical protein H257_09019 [Aphanomyces astaci]
MPLTAAPHKQVYQFLVVNVGLPVVIYYVGREFTSEALALALSAIPPAIEALVQMLAFQTVDPLSVFQIVSISLAIAFMCVTNDPRLLFLKDSLTTALCGVALILSTTWKQNLVLRYYLTGVSDDSKQDTPHLAQQCAHICYVWGSLFIAEALVRVGFIYTCSTDVMVILSPCMALLCSAVGILWARRYLAAQNCCDGCSTVEMVQGVPYNPPPIKIA